MHPSSGRRSLADLAYQQVREEIVACRLAPGQRLTEKQLAADLGLSVTPVREALTRLDHDGLVLTRPRKGYQVTPLTPRSVDALFVMWRILGPELVRLGVRRASAEQLSSAGVVLDELARVQTTAGPGTQLQHVALSTTLFGLLAEASGNEYVVASFERLSGDLGRVWALVLGSDPTAGDDDEVARGMAVAVGARDADAAAATSARYIEQFHGRVMEVLARWPSVMSSEVLPTDQRYRLLG